MKRVEIVTNNGVLCAVIYERDNDFICAERSSSMGFKSFETALNWCRMVCQGKPFTADNDCYKMMPAEVKEEVKKQLSEI